MNRIHPIVFRLTAASTRRDATDTVSFLCSRLGPGRSSSSSLSSSGRPKNKGAGPLDSQLHVPVMREEVLKLWLPERQHGDDDESGETFGDTFGPIHLIDGTVGLGGHTLAAMDSRTGRRNVRVLGIDRDESVLAKAKKRIVLEDTDDSRVTFHHGSFSEISPDLLNHYSFPPKADGILMDLGMCSVQLDNAARGFTFRKHGPLDMRFNTTPNKSGKTSNPIRARDIINEWPASDMALVFKNFADEPYAVEIAADIVQWRKSLSRKGRGGDIRSTLELRYIIEEAIEKIVSKENKKQKTKKAGKKHDFDQFRMIWQSPPKTFGKSRPPPPLAKKKKEKLLSQYEERRIRHANHVMRCFQALRIEVNDELEHVRSFFELGIASRCLEICGRLVVIAFHPGEDLLVREAMGGMVASGEFELLTPEEEGLRPTLDEVKINGRSRTARVRAVQRIR
mmetsp:Transcript_34470/g.83405  ORF Transcript_34470/g.83405 Transcript_34470/m.83405 type:complete len:452 (-) Transcript_34470:348-1703(-)